MNIEKAYFGMRGIWKKPASENTKAKDVPSRIIDFNKKMGIIYILADKGPNLTQRTATIFPSDFIPDDQLL